MQPSLPQRIMKITRPAPLEKTNPIKANSPAPKLRRLLITLFGSGYTGLGHSGSVLLPMRIFLQCFASVEKAKKI